MDSTYALFAVVVLRTKDCLEAWKKTFPDPSNSPAYWTLVLVIGCPHVVAAADGAEDSWISTFSRVVSLEVEECTPHRLRAHYRLEMNFAPFHKLPATLTSLLIHSPALPLLQIFNLILSCPFLEELTLIGDGAEIIDNNPDGPRAVVPSSTSPVFTGLCMRQGLASTTRQLLNLPNGLHFRGLQLQ